MLEIPPPDSGAAPNINVPPPPDAVLPQPPSVAECPPELTFDSIYATHAGPLLAYITGFCGSDFMRAEDIRQEVLIKTWGCLEQGRVPKEHTRAWLFRVARNQCISAYRRDRAGIVEMLSPTDPQPGDKQPASPEDMAESATQRLWVLGALATLPPAHRKILYSTYAPGVTVADLSSRTGIKPGTIKSRAFHGKPMLRDALGDPTDESPAPSPNSAKHRG